MPDKKTLAKILRKGGPNVFAVANAMVNKGQIKPSEKEHVIQSITEDALAGKKRKKRRPRK